MVKTRFIKQVGFAHMNAATSITVNLLATQMNSLVKQWLVFQKKQTWVVPDSIQGEESTY